MLFLSFALVLCGEVLAATASGGDQSTQSASGQQLLVTFSVDTMTLHRRAGSGFKGYAGDAYRRTVTADFVANRLAEDYSLKRVSDWPITVLNVHCVLYQADIHADPDLLTAKLTSDPRVESVQSMHRFQLQSSGDETVGYNDPYLKLQSGWHDLALDQVHRLSTGKGVRIALIDTAVESQHPDLAGRVRLSKSFLDGTVKSTSDFHGTAVAGVMAADANNHIGIVGVAPDAELLSLETCWQEGVGATCNSFTLAQALNYAIEQRVRIINLSLAGPEDSLLHRLVKAAVANNITVVAADSGLAESPFPASVPGVIAVGGIGRKYSSEGNRHLPSILAPAQDVLTTVPSAAYDFVSGSSMAAAYVTGVIALLYESHPSYSAHDLLALLVTKKLSSVGQTAGLPSIEVCALVHGLGSKKVAGTLNCTNSI